MGVELVFRRHHLVELHLDLERRLAGGHAGAVSHAENVGIDRNGRLAEGNIEHHVGGLAPDPGQRLQRLARARDRAAVLADELSRQGDHVLRLGTVEADGLDQALHALLPERRHLLRRVGGREPRGRGFVDAGIGRLRRQHHGDEQREWVDVLELAPGFGPRRLEAAERFFDLRGCPLRQRAGRGLPISRQTFGGALDLGLAAARRAQALRRSARRLAGGPAGRGARCFAGHGSGIVSAMPADNDRTQEPTIFSAVLTPHRSLSRNGFLILMLVMGGISLATGMAFPLAGAWPVFGFCGLDVLLVYLAFQVSYRRAKAYEQVTVTPSELTVRKVSHHGRISEWTLNPLWVRLDRSEERRVGEGGR